MVSSSCCFVLGRSPHGERGLKFWWQCAAGEPKRSLPPRGAWIEIGYGFGSGNGDGCRSPHGERGLKFTPEIVIVVPVGSLPPRGAWIEMALNRNRSKHYWSLPPRGAWIEILIILFNLLTRKVAPPTGSVD